MSALAPNPKQNFIFDLNLTLLLVSPHRCLMQAPLTRSICSAKGTARVGVLATMVDVACSDPALAACRPDWTATQDLSIHATDWLTEGPVVVDARLVRLGKKTIVVSADVYDGRGIENFDELQKKIDCGAIDETAPTRVAKSLLTFARIPGTAASGVDSHNPGKWVGQVRRKKSEVPAEGSLNERLGLTVCDPTAGILELACKPYVANSIGTINGGVQAIAMEAAAEAMRPGMIATDMQIHYLSQLKVGPVRTAGSISRNARDHSVVTVQLLDAGSNNRLLTMATIVLQSRD